MSVDYSGKKFYYRFRVKGKRHYGISEGCTTEEQALAYEAQVNARLRKEVEAAQEKLRQEEQKLPSTIMSVPLLTIIVRF